MTTRPPDEESDTPTLTLTLPLTPLASVVRTWAPFNNTDLALRTNTAWKFALDLSSSKMQFYENPESFNESLPFGFSKYFGVIQVSGVPLLDWNITKKAAAEPIPSPIECNVTREGCGVRVSHCTQLG